MPLTGAIPEGPSFFCPHCGALYAVTYARLSSCDSNVARCVVCGHHGQMGFAQGAYLQAHSSTRRSLGRLPIKSSAMSASVRERLTSSVAAKQREGPGAVILSHSIFIGQSELFCSDFAQITAKPKGRSAASIFCTCCLHCTSSLHWA